jgi:Type IV pilus assembly protein PilM
MKWVQRAREEYAALADWWLHEMREAVAGLEQWWAPGKPHRTTIYLTPTLGRVEQRWRDGTIKSVEFQQTASGDFSDEWREFLAQSASARVHVVLSRSGILIRRSRLPTAAESNLASVIELQLERELPVPRDQVQVDWRIEARDPAQDRIDVSIAAVRRSEVETLLGALNQSNLRVLSLSVDMGAEYTAFNFAPRRTLRKLGQLARIDRWLTASAAALVVLWTLVVGAQWLRERFVVNAALTSANVPAQRVEHLRAQLTKRSKPLQELLRLMQLPSSAEILADLTAAVPGDSWLPQLIIQVDDSDSVIKLTAITPAAASLVERLESAPHIERVELQSSSAAGLATERDRVELSAHWMKPKLVARAAGTP